jgi:transposase
MGIGQHRRKNDRIDADVMALAVDTGGIPLAHSAGGPRSSVVLSRQGHMASGRHQLK